MSMPTLKELVKNGQRVHFMFYRKGELYYRTSSGFEFPVPVEDCGDAVFLAEDKALLFMRYIRKQLERIEEGKQFVSAPCVRCLGKDCDGYCHE